ncbi:hypothetical protein PWG71_16520 [Nocardiopsis sp. N85]|uniref:hypothetical protein n=1 Tax=Nocardiopsis sp. N85 TaxID=3029400 RepID=UPI00237F52BC|nr:hypothetical protein [Nocardiopsis sp. N85]MDE3722995.1 hypothetical protein [Nocardiopsis sp. N85]
MIEDFRRAVADVVAAARTRPHDVLPLAGTLFQLAGHVPVGERSEALAVIAERLRAPERIALGAVADLSVLCGALVEVGTPAGPAGVEITRRAREVGAQALRFAEAWESTGDDDPPHPRETGEPHRARVTPVLGDADMYALAAWATMQPYGIAIRAVLGDAEVRVALREDPRGLAELLALATRMRRHVEEFAEVYELLLMAEVDRLLVLDRVSGRAFRVRFDGVGDNFQLHTLLADALIGPEGRGVPGQRPMPDWVASATDLRDDPRLSIVDGEWDLVGGDGTWVGNEATPGAVPVVNGERVLVLEPISLKHTWRTGRRHPHIPGWLRIEEELNRDEAAAWWTRVHAAGSVLHPLVQSQEETSPVVDVPPEEISGAWNADDEATEVPEFLESRGGSGSSGVRNTDDEATEVPESLESRGGSGSSGVRNTDDEATEVPESLESRGGSGSSGVRNTDDEATEVPESLLSRRGSDSSADGPWSPTGDRGAPPPPEPWGVPAEEPFGDHGTARPWDAPTTGTPGAHEPPEPWSTVGGETPGHAEPRSAEGDRGAAGRPGGPEPFESWGAPADRRSDPPGNPEGPAPWGAPHGAETENGGRGSGAHRAPGGEGVPAGPPGAFGPPEPWQAVGSGDRGEPWGAPDDPAAAGVSGGGEEPGEGFVPPGASLVPPPPPDRWEVEEEPRPEADRPRTDRVPPGAGLLEPMPEGVSDSSGWGPSWKS